MTRKSALLFWLALGTVAPGCQSFPSLGNSTGAGPRKIYDRAQIHAKDLPDHGIPIHSTAIPPEEPTTILTKAPSAPKRDPEKLTVPPLDLMVAQPIAAKDGPKKKPAGVSGVVTVDQGPPGQEPKNAVYQIPAVPTLAGNDVPKQEIEPLARAVHLMMIGEHQDAIKELRGYDEATQEFFIRIMPLLMHIAKTSIDKMSSQEIAVLNDVVKGVGDLLRTRCELLVTKMVYCKRISGFADYEALPADHAFLAKTDNRAGDLVQLYVELKNFASKKVNDNEYLTKLACSLELKDMHGQKIWGYTFDRNETTHRKSACVNDYHGIFSFYVPALPTGTYNLTIQVVDETIPEHRRLARKSLAFRVTPVANQLAPR